MCRYGPGVSSASSRATSSTNWYTRSLPTSSVLKPTSVPVYGFASYPAGASSGYATQRRVHVPRQVDLRDDDDPRSAAYATSSAYSPWRVPAARPAADLGRASDLREPRPRADLDPPALVVA